MPARPNTVAFAAATLLLAAAAFSRLRSDARVAAESGLATRQAAAGRMTRGSTADSGPATLSRFAATAHAIRLRSLHISSPRQRQPEISPLPPAYFRPMALAAAAPRGGPEPVLVELRLGRVASRTVEAYRVGDEALIPLSQFFALAGIHAAISSQGEVEAAISSSTPPLSIGLVRDTATFGRRRVSVPAALKVFVGGELYFPASRLGELLDAPFYVDWQELAVVMRDPGLLPVALEIRRRAARAALERARSRLPIDRLLPTDRRRWDGFVVDYSWLLPNRSPVGASSYAVQAGADFLGGSLELGASSVGRADAGDIRLDASWLGVWRDNPWLKQLRLGDGLTTGPRPRTLRGVSVTNAPFVRPSLIGVVPYAGRLPTGWQVEAYRAGELIAFDSTDARGDYAVRLPVLYGENPVDFIAYGPFGETRTFGRTYRVSSALLPSRRFEYGLSGGACRFGICDGTANVDLRYGLTSRVTVQAGADRFWRESLPDLFHPYASVTGSVSNALTIQAEGVGHAYGRATANLEPSLDQRFAVSYTRYDTKTVSPLLTIPGRRSLLEASGFYRPIPDRDFFYFEGSAERSTGDFGTIDRARVGASFQAAEVRLMPYTRIERFAPAGAPATTSSFYGLGAIILPRHSWGRILRQTFVRGSVEAQGTSRFNAASLAAARPLTSAIRLEVGVNWLRGLGAPIYTMTLSTYLRSFRSYTTATAQPGAPATASQLVQGSVLYDRTRRSVDFAPGPSLQRAGISGRVFLDANGNGRYDAGEQGLNRVRVQVGSTNAISDSSGEYHLWDVVPFEPVAVAVDSMSFESPLWVPSFPMVVVAPGPNRYTAVNIPIAIGSVIEGRVLRAFGGGTRGVGGVTLTLTEERTGRRQTIATFTDGSFYALGIRPGHYVLAVEPEVMSILRVAAEPRRLTIDPSGAEPGSIDIVLTPRP